MGPRRYGFGLQFFAFLFDKCFTYIITGADVGFEYEYVNIRGGSSKLKGFPWNEIKEYSGGIFHEENATRDDQDVQQISK